MHIYINKSVLPSLLLGFLFKRRGGEGVWGASSPDQGIFIPGGQAAKATVSYPHPFLFREEWLMVHFMTIQMAVQ